MSYVSVGAVTQTVGSINNMKRPVGMYHRWWLIGGTREKNCPIARQDLSVVIISSVHSGPLPSWGKLCDLWIIGSYRASRHTLVDAGHQTSPRWGRGHLHIYHSRGSPFLVNNVCFTIGRSPWSHAPPTTIRGLRNFNNSSGSFTCEEKESKNSIVSVCIHNKPQGATCN